MLCGGKNRKPHSVATPNLGMNFLPAAIRRRAHPQHTFGRLPPLWLGQKRTETTIVRKYRPRLLLRKSLWIAQAGTKVQ
jgi:hypothetical protein